MTRTTPKTSTTPSSSLTLDGLATAAQHLRLHLIVTLSTNAPLLCSPKKRPPIELLQLSVVCRDLHQRIRASPCYAEDQLAISFAWALWTATKRSSLSKALSPYPNGLAHHLRTCTHENPRVADASTPSAAASGVNAYTLAIEHANATNGIARVHQWAQSVETLSCTWSYCCRAADCTNRTPPCQLRKEGKSASCLLRLVCKDKASSHWVNTICRTNCTVRCTCYCSEGCRHAAESSLPHAWKLRQQTLHSVRLIEQITGSPAKFVPLDVSAWLNDALKRNRTICMGETDRETPRYDSRAQTMFSRKSFEQLHRLVVRVRDMEVAMLYVYTSRPRTAEERMLGVGTLVDRKMLLSFLYQKFELLRLLLECFETGTTKTSAPPRPITSLVSTFPAWFAELRNGLLQERESVDTLTLWRSHLSNSSRPRTETSLSTPRLSPSPSPSRLIPSLKLTETASNLRYRLSTSLEMNKSTRRLPIS